MNEVEWKLDSVLGYVYAIDSTSPYASAAGKVYQHHHVMCTHIGRKLYPEECVHHIDRDKTNNRIENLMLLTKSEHAILHAMEDRGYTPDIRICAFKDCGKSFITSLAKDQTYCSITCSHKVTRKFEVEKDELERMVWSMPTTDIAAMYGVSDVAIAKRCKVLGVRKPPRGYWARIRSMNLQ